MVDRSDRRRLMVAADTGQRYQACRQMSDLRGTVPCVCSCPSPLAAMVLTCCSLVG